MLADEESLTSAGLRRVLGADPINGSRSMTHANTRSLARGGLSPTPGVPVRVLELDRDLAAGVDESQRPLASGAAIAPAYEFDRGPWRFFPPSDRGALGALLLHGLIIVRIETGGHAHAELLGSGDVISPWVGTGSDLNVPSVVTARILSTLRVALLDRRFVLRTARWPEIQAALMHRLIMRARRLSLQAAINGLPRIEERLELTLWQLGDRFGRVTRNGIVVHLPLSHSQLAEMIGAQRPSVSTAATSLARKGRVVRLRRDEWLLRGEPPTRLAPMARQVGLAASRPGT